MIGNPDEVIAVLVEDDPLPLVDLFGDWHDAARGAELAISGVNASGLTNVDPGLLCNYSPPTQTVFTRELAQVTLDDLPDLHC